jgi:transposase
MNEIEYIGMDLHKKVIVYCVKRSDGSIVEEGTLDARREELELWARRRRAPWIAAMEATLFTGWVYDTLKPHAREIKVAHPLMLRAIAASKKKNDRIDARKIADLLRCDLLPQCYMAPSRTRELRRVLRYRNLMVREAVRMKNKTAGLLMEVGAPYAKNRLHGKRYFAQLLDRLQDVPASVVDLLRLSRSSAEIFQGVQKRLIAALLNDRALAARVERLMTIPGVGEVTALTWALEIGEVERFRSIGQAVSYCGLCSGQHQSAGQEHRGPISKQRNRHLQTVLIEAAKLAPRWNEELAQVHEREIARGNRNRATLAVARKLVGYLMAVDRQGRPFEIRGTQDRQAA